MPAALLQGYVTADQCTVAPSESGCIAPVRAPVVSGFHTPDRPTHNGVDLAAARGTPIRAAASGTVLTVQCNVVPETHGCDRDGSPQIRGCDPLTAPWCCFTGIELRSFLRLH